MMNDVNIVIGSWGSYNECNDRALGSQWLRLNDYDDWTEIEEELQKQGFQLNDIDEELFVQDIENLPADGVVWDYVHPKNLFELLKTSGILDDGSLYNTMEAVCEVIGYDEWAQLVRQHDQHWADDVCLYPNMTWFDLGYQYIHEICCYEIPDALENYIDYAGYGESFSYDGFYEYSDGIIEIRR